MAGSWSTRNQLLYLCSAVLSKTRLLIWKQSLRPLKTEIQFKYSSFLEDLTQSALGKPTLFPSLCCCWLGSFPFPPSSLEWGMTSLPPEPGMFPNQHEAHDTRKELLLAQHCSGTKRENEVPTCQSHLLCQPVHMLKNAFGKHSVIVQICCYSE